MGMMRRSGRVLRGIEYVGQGLTVLLMLTTMLIVFIDVMLRHFFNRPLVWAYDLVGMYLLAGTYFLALADSYAAHAHVGVDILIRNLPERFRRLSEILTSILGIGLFALISWMAFQRGAESFFNNDVISGPIPWPTWISSALVAIGSWLLIARLHYRLIGNILSLASDTAVVEPLPIAGAHRGE